MATRSFNLRLKVSACFMLVFIIINAIPSAAIKQTSVQNAEASLADCTVRNWGWPFTDYSSYGGGGFISPMELLPMDATPIFSQWHIVGLILNVAFAITVTAIVLCVRMPGLPGEGQENVEIIRDSDREEGEDESSLI